MTPLPPPSVNDSASACNSPETNNSQSSVQPPAQAVEVAPGLLLPLFDAMLCTVGVVFPSKWLHSWLLRLKIPEQAQIRIFDVYVISWMLFSPLLLLLAGTRAQFGRQRLLLGAVACWRALEILHIAVNILLFGRFRKSDDYTVSSARRSLLINVLNYIEFIVLFATIYAAGLARDIRPAVDRSLDALYFSTVTMTTLGYGDYLPATGFARAIVALQAVIGIFFVALILGRVLTLLPQPRRS